MRITLTGPRSVGKSTIAKLVAKKINLKYISSDEIGEKAMKKYGGLDKAIKSGIITKFIKKSGYGLIRKVYTQDNFVFDLSGGAFTSKKNAKASAQVRAIAQKKSIIIGLLPYKQIKRSYQLLYNRERKRAHFKTTSAEALVAKTKEDYAKFPPIFKEISKYVIYTENRKPEAIAQEIVTKLKRMFT